jgi:8-oxo-dGTP pyrophosphatase MutT (NUDIX family)
MAEMTKKNIIKQSGVIAYGDYEGELSVILVTSMDGRRWVLPKGHIEPHLSANESAEKEAFEEGGIEGVVSNVAIGFYDYFKQSNKNSTVYRVSLFPMKILRLLKDWPEANLRTRQWMTIRQAIDAVKEKDAQLLLKKFGEEMAMNTDSSINIVYVPKTSTGRKISKIRELWNKIIPQ